MIKQLRNMWSWWNFFAIIAALLYFLTDKDIFLAAIIILAVWFSVLTDDELRKMENAESDK